MDAKDSQYCYGNLTSTFWQCYMLKRGIWFACNGHDKEVMRWAAVLHGPMPMADRGTLLMKRSDTPDSSSPHSSLPSLK